MNIATLPLSTHLSIIRNMLIAERTMCNVLYRRDVHKKKQKITEIGNGLGSLSVIESALIHRITISLLPHIECVRKVLDSIRHRIGRADVKNARIIDGALESLKALEQQLKSPKKSPADYVHIVRPSSVQPFIR